MEKRKARASAPARRIFAALCLAALSMEAGAECSGIPMEPEAAQARKASGESSPAAGRLMATGAASVGVVCSVDARAGRIAIRHEGVRGLGMPPMDTAFRSKNPKAIAKAKAGERVVFIPVFQSGDLWVSRLEPAR